MSHELPPRWKYFGNISTAVEILSPRWKYYCRGGNIITAVEIVFHLIQGPANFLGRGPKC